MSRAYRDPCSHMSNREGLIAELRFIGDESIYIACAECGILVPEETLDQVAPEDTCALEDEQEPCHHMLYMSLYYDETPRKVALNGVSHTFMECEPCDISVPLSKLLP